MMGREDDPFYVGYHPVAPRPGARATGIAVFGIIVLTLGTGAALAWSTPLEDPGVFELGHPRQFIGRLQESPYPSLLVPADSQRHRIYVRYLLVQPGKFGAQAAVRGLDGQWVAVAGERIARPGAEMLEVTAHGIAPAMEPDSALPFLGQTALGTRTYQGEVVDGKCWLGVMRPATGNVHRGCAYRCLSGGIPPLLMTYDAEGRVQHLLLTDADGHQAHQRFRELVGRPVTVSGPVFQEGDLLVMRVERIGLRE
jgi:hypothetical protein